MKKKQSDDGLEFYDISIEIYPLNRFERGVA